MPTEFLTAVATEGIALYHRGQAAVESLCTFLRERGYRVYPLDEVPALLALVQGGKVDLSLVAAEDTLEPRELQALLEELSPAHPVIMLCDEARSPAVETIAGDVETRRVLVRPVPFAHIVGEIERQLEGRVKEREAGQAPALLFAKLLADLWQEQRTGRLRVIVNGVQTTIYLREGLPVFAEQGSLEESLGRVLMRAGRLTPEDFSRAVALITERMVDNEQMRLGEALVELGIMSASDVHEALRDQVRLKILACFRAQRFHCDLREGADALEAVGEFSTPMERVLSEGLRTVDPQHLDRFLAPFAESFPRLLGSVEALVELHGSSPREASFAAALTGEKPLRLLRDNSQLDPIHASQVLSTLILARRVELLPEARREVPPAPPDSRHAASTAASAARPGVAGNARIAPAEHRRPGSARLPGRAPDDEVSSLMSLYLKVKGKSDHQVLEVSADASREQIEEAFRRRTREVESVQLPPGQPPPSAKRIVQAVTDQLREARDRLLAGSSVSPAHEDTAPAGSNDKKERLLAEEAYQEALGHYRQGNLKEALESSSRAAELQPEELHYRLLSAWLSYRTAPQKSRAKIVARAHEAAREAFARDGSSWLANLVLGHLLGGQGKRERARRHLLLALRNDGLGSGEIQRELLALDQGVAPARPVQASKKPGRT